VISLAHAGKEKRLRRGKNRKRKMTRLTLKEIGYRMFQGATSKGTTKNTVKYRDDEDEKASVRRFSKKAPTVEKDLTLERTCL